MPLSPNPATVTSFVQSTPSVTWTIVHGQKSYPIVDVYVDISGVVQKIMPLSVVYVDQDTVDVNFSVARSGFATIVV